MPSSGTHWSCTTDNHLLNINGLGCEGAYPSSATKFFFMWQSVSDGRRMCGLGAGLYVQVRMSQSERLCCDDSSERQRYPPLSVNFLATDHIRLTSRDAVGPVEPGFAVQHEQTAWSEKLA